MKKLIFLFGIMTLMLFLAGCSTEHTVEFETNGGSVVNSQTVEEGSLIQAPNATREGYTLDGWYTSVNNGQTLDEKWSFTNNSVNNDITLYANWIVNQYTITFDTDGGTQVSSITQDFDSLVSAPISPSKTGHTFTGWSEEVPNTMPAEDKTLTAQWQINQYTVTYKDYDGTVLFEEDYDFQTSLDNISVSDPTRTGHTFTGWTSDLPNTMPARDIEITANYDINQYTITFETDGGTEINSITKDYDSSIIAPINPTKEGHTFTGWSEDVPTNMPAENKTLTALWKINQYTVTYKDHDGTVLFEEEYKYGASISNVAVSEPYREGFTFTGWSTEIPAKMPANNVVINALWEANQYKITHYIFDVDYEPNRYLVPLKSNEFLSEVIAGGSSIITTEGRVFVWGNNIIERADDSDFLEEDSSIELTNLLDLEVGETVNQISFNQPHKGLLTSKGRLFMWGFNYYGQLGNGTNKDQNEPIDITNRFNLHEEEKITQISFGVNHSSAITSNNRIFMWGYNYYGQLGDGFTDNISSPIDITSRFPLNLNEEIVSLSLGDSHSAALTSDGRLLMWGSTALNEFGDYKYNYAPYDKSTIYDVTDVVDLNPEEKITEIEMGFGNSGILTSENRAFLWGNNSYGQIGNGSTSTSNPFELNSVLQLQANEKISDLKLSSGYAAVLTSNGRLFTWGNNSHGQLGQDTILMEYRPDPKEITQRLNLKDNETVDSISLGYRRAAAKTSEGRIFAWGQFDAGYCDVNTYIGSYPSIFNNYYNYFSSLTKRNYYYGQAIESQKVSRDGHVFDGWYLDSCLKNPFDLDKMPSEDLILYGRWIPEE